MITSYASVDIAVKATNDGATDFIPKPFTPQELKSSIEQITKQQYLKRITHQLDEEGKKIRYQFLSVRITSYNVCYTKLLRCGS